MSNPADAGRRILVETNISRPEASQAVDQVIRACSAEGIEVRMIDSTLEAVIAELGRDLRVEGVPHSGEAAVGCELVLVIGGDGTFLRASEYARGADVPVLGVNHGHMGFLAESEFSSLREVVEQLVTRQYHVVGRMTVSARILHGDRVLGEGWALNEASLEKVERRGVLEATVEVDGRPVSDFGCDGVIISTPTGSTAYAYSAGGPIVWPELDAMLVVPNNAHALFASPLVVAPSSRVAVETAFRSGPSVLMLDGRRMLEVPAGSRVEIQAGLREVKWVRLDDAPFTDRLVHKFRLPVEGWRGRGVEKGAERRTR